MKDPCFPGTWPSVSVSQFTATMSAFLTVFITTGNVLIIGAIVKDPRRQLRTPFAYFLANLALSDLIVGVVAMPVSVMFHVMEVNRSINQFSVYVVHITFFISLAASLFSMAAMCLDRYWTLASLSKNERRFTRRRCIGISAAIWLLSIAFTSLYPLTGYIKLVTVYLNISFLCIFGITLLTYIKIMRTLKAISKILDRKAEEDTVGNNKMGLYRWWKKNGQSNEYQSGTDTAPKRMRANLAANASNDVDNGRSNSGRRRAKKSIYKQKKKLAREERITSIFLTLLATFLSSHLPAIVFTYILQFCLSCKCDARHVLRDIVFLLIPTASGLNAVICILKLPYVRIAVKETLLCNRKNIYIFSSTDMGENSKNRSPRQWYTQRNMYQRERIVSRDVEFQIKYRLPQRAPEDPKSNASSDSELVIGLKNPGYTIEDIQDQEAIAPAITADCERNQTNTRTRSNSFPGCIPTLLRMKKNLDGMGFIVDRSQTKTTNICIAHKTKRASLET